MKTRILLILTLSGLVLSACGNNEAPKMQGGAPAASAASSGSAAAPAKAADENAALEAIQKVNEGQATYFKVNRRYALTFEELTEAHLLNAEPTAAQTGYEFKLRPAADAQTYKLTVSPETASAAARSFFTDNTGVIRAETGKDATAESGPVLTK